MKLNIPNIDCVHSCKYYNFKYIPDGKGNEIKVAKCNKADKGLEDTGFAFAPDWCPLYEELTTIITSVMKSEGYI